MDARTFLTKIWQKKSVCHQNSIFGRKYREKSWNFPYGIFLKKNHIVVDKKLNIFPAEIFENIKEFQFYLRKFFSTVNFSTQNMFGFFLHRHVQIVQYHDRFSIFPSTFKKQIFRKIILNTFWIKKSKTSRRKKVFSREINYILWIKKMNIYQAGQATINEEFQFK